MPIRNVVGSGGSTAAWGGITGTLANQTDLQAALTHATPRAITDTADDLELLDAGKTLICNKATAQEVTIPLHSAIALANNAQIVAFQYGAGVLTITAASGVDLNGIDGGSVALSAQYKPVYLLQVSEDAWVIWGALDGVVA